MRLERLEDRRLLTAYAVDSLDDVYYPDPGSYPVDGFVTLREALEAANTNTQVGDAAPGSGLETDLVEFDADLFIGEPATITLAGRELEIAGDVDVQGPGLDQLAIDADDQSRVFYVGAGIEAAISGLVLIGGFIDDGEAGGGGIFNAGTLTVTDSTISGNSAEDAGGVYNTGTLTVTNSTLSGNSASRFGGGILNFHAGTLTVANSTLGGNTASSGGGIYSSSAELTVTNSIVALNTAFSDPDVRGSAAPPSGFHLIGTDPMFVRNPSAGTDGIWGTADDDFGDLRLRFDSPAIDAGDPSFDPDAFEPSLTTDQGGNPRILDGDDNGSEIVDLGAYEYAPSVVGSYLYYRGSRFDFGPGDNAVATDKRPLIAGQTATAANYSNYDAGINGLMIDVNRPDDGYEFSADDFVFRLGNDDNPAGWQLAPPPTQIVTRPGLGVGGSIRVNVVWENDAVKNTWLQVTVPANEDTDLLEDEVFYFGNAAGETGNDPAGGLVNAADIIGARDNPHGLLNLAPITDPFDFNRDRRIDAVDMIMARNNATSPFNALRLITGDTQPVYTFAAGISQGNLEDSETRDEISGLAVGISNPAVLWGVNDGTSTGLFAIGLDGSDLGTWTLSGVSVTDVEDMAAATVGGANYLYVGDIGDNNAVRSTINILRFEEPTGSPGSITGIEQIVCQYPMSPGGEGLGRGRDAETLLVDPLTGDMYVITKRTFPSSSLPQVFKLPHQTSYSRTQTLLFLGTMIGPTMPGSPKPGHWTGGSMSSDGLNILMKTYDQVFRYSRASGAIPVIAALSEPGVEMEYVGLGNHPTQEPQGEAITFNSDDSGYYTLSESRGGSSPTSFPLFYYERL